MKQEMNEKQFNNKKAWRSNLSYDRRLARFDGCDSFNPVESHLLRDHHFGIRGSEGSGDAVLACRTAAKTS